MIKSLKVILWDKEIGRLSWDERLWTSYFTYNPDFIKTGLDVSPLAASVSSVRSYAPVWGEEAKIYQKLPAFLADSLPDAWGNLLFDLWRQQHHLANTDVNPLDKLSFIGKRGMGALEFQPETSGGEKTEKIEMTSLVELAQRTFAEREDALIMPEESITMQSLLTVGTSAGGRQPKAIIAIDRNTGEIRSGQVPGLDNYDYSILKFGNSQYSSAELEMTYYEMAKAAGITMMPSELYPVDGNNHFLTKRFDREGNTKLHTQTLAAICPKAKSYEQLMAVCRKLRLPESDCIEVFRRMVFNVLANNTDDHNKNFSFIMSQDGKWRLSPAYDITYIIDRGGFLPHEDHCLYIRGKFREITRDDILQFAKNNGIRRPDAIIKDVADSLKKFRPIASRYGVKKQWIGRVETTIINHLMAWGEIEAPTISTAKEINGHKLSNIRLELTYKGNYHLYADIDGIERKYIIGKNKEEYQLIENNGIIGISDEQLTLMAVRLFRLQ